MKAILFLIVFGPITLCIIGFFLLVGKLMKNASKDEWEGEVINKSHNTKDKEDNNHLKEHFYTLIIKTTKGEERKIPVTAGIYESAKAGDKYIKVKGKLNPQKV
jgi:hypothetical protein